MISVVWFVKDEPSDKSGMIYQGDRYNLQCGLSNMLYWMVSWELYLVDRDLVDRGWLKMMGGGQFDIWWIGIGNGKGGLGFGGLGLVTGYGGHDI